MPAARVVVMDYSAAAVLLFCLLISANMYWLGGKIIAIEAMLKAIIDGGRFAMPRVNLNGSRVFELSLKAGKRFAERAKEKREAKRRKNLGGVGVVPDVDDFIMRKFCRVLLREIEESDDIEAVKLTESVWLAGGKFRELVGGSPAQFRACMERLEANRVITRSDGRGVRAWAQPYRSVTAKLKKIIKQDN